MQSTILMSYGPILWHGMTALKCWIREVWTVQWIIPDQGIETRRQDKSLWNQFEIIFHCMYRYVSEAFWHLSSSIYNIKFSSRTKFASRFIFLKYGSGARSLIVCQPENNSLWPHYHPDRLKNKKYNTSTLDDTINAATMKANPL